MKSDTPIRVLVIDDSAFVRQALTAGLAEDRNIEVVGAAADPYEARDLIMELNPDVLTLDIEMPRMNGVEFLRKLMPQRPLPVVMVSAFTERGTRVTLDALEAGAVDFVAKPKAQDKQALQNMLLQLRTKVKIAYTAKLVTGHRQQTTHTTPVLPTPTRTECIVAIGASTGGTEAVREILEAMPAECPGIVVVQHMPAGFTRMYAERLNSLCALEVKEAEDGDRIIPGRAIIAAGGKQLSVTRSAGQLRVRVGAEDLVNGHCPSVDVLFHSVAETLGRRAVGVILTGMGRDGAAGLKALHDTGAACFGQDEASCVVFGMPKEAAERGAVDRLVPLERMTAAILDALSKLSMSTSNPNGGAK